MRFSFAFLMKYAQAIENSMIDPTGKVYPVGDMLHNTWCRLHKGAFGIFAKENENPLSKFFEAGWLRFAEPDSIQGIVTSNNMETVKNIIRRVARVQRGSVRTFYVEFSKTDYVTIPISPTGVVDFTELDMRVGA